MGIPAVSAALLLAVLATATSACGSDGEDEASTTTSNQTTTVAPSPPTGDGGPTPPTSPAAMGTKPEVTVPEGPPPTTLQIEDLVVGTGEVAAPGQQIRVHYVGVAYSTRKQFDASWDGGEPLGFRLGQGDVIPGWDKGVPGMKVGGRRQLIIPPDLAYGRAGFGTVIKPNETLIFVVDLISVGP